MALPRGSAKVQPLRRWPQVFGAPARRQSCSQAGPFSAGRALEFALTLNWPALLRSARASANALELAERRYRGSAGSYLAVLQNRRDLFALSQQAAQAETEPYLNVVALY